MSLFVGMALAAQGEQSIATSDLLIETIGLLALVTQNRQWMIYAWPCIVGIGVGTVTILPNVLISLSVPHQLM